MWFDTSNTYSPSSAFWAAWIFRLLMLFSKISLCCLMDCSSLPSFIHLTLSSGEPFTLQSRLTGSPMVTFISPGFSKIWGGSIKQSKHLRGFLTKFKLWKHLTDVSQVTLHCERSKALILSSLVYHLTDIFTAVRRLTGGNPESCHVVLKCSLNLWILQNPVLIFLPLYRQSGRAYHNTLKLCLLTQNGNTVLEFLRKCWRFY